MERDRLVRRAPAGVEEPGTELDGLATAVIGAAIEVHRHLGAGLNEALYRDALCAELRRRSVPHGREVVVPVYYKGELIGSQRLDLLVGGALVVELKTCEYLTDVHRAQVLTYLTITGLRLALLINFNVPLLKDGIKRIVRTSHPS